MFCSLCSFCSLLRDRHFPQAKLVPTDDITIVYKIGQVGSSQKDVDAFKTLVDVVQSHLSYINDSVKQKVVPSPIPTGLPEVIHEDMEVRFKSGLKLSKKH